MANRIKGITIELGGDTKGLNKALSDVNKQGRDLQSELREVDRLLKFDPKNTELLAQKQKLLSKSVEDSKEKLEALKTAQTKADEAIANGTEISEGQYRKLQREIASTEQGLERLEKQAKETSKGFDMNSPAIQKMNTAANNILKVGAGAAIAGGTASAKMSIEFEDAMAKVSTVADETEMPISLMKNQIIDLSNQTGISAVDIANNVYDAISAGQKTSAAINFVEKSTKLAKSGFAEAGQSLDILTTILNAYGLESEKATDVSDILIQIQNKGKVTVGELSASMGKIIPTAKASNVSLEQLGAGYAIMTSKGIASAETTTYMNSMLNELSKSGTNASDTIKEKTGKSFQDLMKEGKSLADVLKILDDDAKSNGKSMADMFGSAEAGKAALTLLSDGAEKFNGTVKEMTSSTGATDKAFEKLQTPGEELRKSFNELKNEGIKLGEALTPIIQKITEIIRVIINNKEVFAVLAGTVFTLTLAFKGLMIVSTLMDLYKKFEVATKLATISQTLFNGAMLASPIGPIVAIVGSLVTIIGALAIANNNAKTGYEALTDAQKKSVDEVNAQVDSYNDLKKAQEEKASADLAEVANAEKLWAELQTLSDSKGKIKESDKARVEFINGELNKAYGLELKLVGDTIQGYDKATESIDKLMEKRKADILLQANEPLYKKALLEYGKLEEQQTKKTIDLEKQRKKVEDLRKTAGSPQGGNKKFDEFIKEKNALEELEKSYGQNENLLRTYYGNIKTFEDATAENIQGNTGKVLTLLDNKNTGFINATSIVDKSRGDQKKILEGQVVDTETNARLMRERFNAGVAGVSEDMVKAAEEKAKKAKEELGKLGNEAGGALVDGMSNGVETKKKGWLSLIGDILTRMGYGMIKYLQDMINNGVDMLNKITPGSPFKKVSWVPPTMPMLATGGILHNGQAIVAEAGPELIEQINGKTRVTPLTGSSRNTMVESQKAMAPITIITKTYLDKKEVGYSVAEYVKKQNTFEDRRVMA